MPPSCLGCIAEAQPRAAGAIDQTQIVGIAGERLVGDSSVPPEDGAPQDEPPSGAASPEDRPRIDAGIGDLSEVTVQAWAALAAGNDPPTLFRFGSVPARIENDDEGSPLVREMTQDRMRHRLARDAAWYAIVKKGSAEQEHPVHPPMPVVRNVLATPDPPLPTLTRIVE